MTVTVNEFAKYLFFYGFGFLGGYIVENVSGKIMRLVIASAIIFVGYYFLREAWL